MTKKVPPGRLTPAQIEALITLASNDDAWAVLGCALEHGEIEDVLQVSSEFYPMFELLGIVVNKTVTFTLE